jgi:hypothetical protein
MDEHWRFLRTSQDFQTPEFHREITNYFPNNDKVTFTASFYSNWLASGQIPQRAVDSGLIGRFRAIDATEGGNTSRSNFQATYFQNYWRKCFDKHKCLLHMYDFNIQISPSFLEDPMKRWPNQTTGKQGIWVYQVVNLIKSLISVIIKSVDFKSGIGLQKRPGSG